MKITVKMDKNEVDKVLIDFMAVKFPDKEITIEEKYSGVFEFEITPLKTKEEKEAEEKEAEESESEGA